MWGNVRVGPRLVGLLFLRAFVGFHRFEDVGCAQGRNKRGVMFEGGWDFLVCCFSGHLLALPAAAGTAAASAASAAASAAALVFTTALAVVTTVAAAEAAAPAAAFMLVLS